MTDREPYPPKQHMLADLGLSIRIDDDGAVWVTAPFVTEIGNRAGVVGAGPLGVAVDVLGGNLAIRAVQPDWCLTSSLELHLLRPLARDFTVRGMPLRAGRTSIVLDATVEDGDEAAGPAAVASMTFTRVPRRADTLAYREPETEGYRFGGEDAHLSAPFFEQLGCRVRDAASGSVELAMSDYVRNSVGALQGGAIVSLCDAAAEAVASSRMTDGVATLDLQVHFLALGRVGPIRTRARWLAGDERDARLRVDLVDVGRGERPIAMATLRLGSHARGVAGAVGSRAAGSGAARP